MPQLPSGRHVGFAADAFFGWLDRASPNEALQLLSSGFTEDDLLSILFLVEYPDAGANAPSEANPDMGNPKLSELTLQRVLDGAGDWTDEERRWFSEWLQGPRARGILTHIREEALRRIAAKPVPESLRGILEPGDD